MSIFVNRIEITEAEVGQEMQYHPAPTQERAWRLAAQSLVVRQLLLQQAANNGLFQEADTLSQEEREAAIIDQLLQQDVVVPEADETTCQRYYDSHPGSFMDKESSLRLTFDQAKNFIRDYLHTKAMRMAVAEYIKALSYDADIEGIELVGSEITLPE
jgi:hypothetical protein